MSKQDFNAWLKAIKEKRVSKLRAERNRLGLTIKQMAERHNVCYERMRQLLKAD